ncbi:hypothetical protein [Deinococcus multiflagellatus]|uniref:Uncharacterized protein n=1 Tax=Deinococcus multiflagellatus TaxID=1656887 RepID=A0ABW1ZJ73_9DEIO|nr:hypothetical protein [Deinococcus multiflagellatus]MBZ9712358.1 hypothetical protein [Deinococcus multiflagellatus]
MVTWAAAAGYAVCSDHDHVYLQAPGGTDLYLGWMYGNPTGAWIEPEGRLIVIVGYGFWLMQLPLPPEYSPEDVPSLSLTQALQTKLAPAPALAIGNQPEQALWIDRIMTDAHVVNRLLFEVDAVENGVAAARYTLDLNTMTFWPVTP